MLDPEDQRELAHQKVIDLAYQNSGLHRIDVDINSLSDFADALRREYTENLIPAWKKISTDLVNPGPQFGVSPELDLDDKRVDYQRSVDRAATFLRNVIAGVYQLAESAEEIGRRYQRADQFAKVNLGDVTSVLPSVPPANAVG